MSSYVIMVFEGKEWTVDSAHVDDCASRGFVLAEDEQVTAGKDKPAQSESGSHEVDEKKDKVKQKPNSKAG